MHLVCVEIEHTYNCPVGVCTKNGRVKNLTPAQTAWHNLTLGCWEQPGPNSGISAWGQHPEPPTTGSKGICWGFPHTELEASHFPHGMSKWRTCTTGEGCQGPVAGGQGNCRGILKFSKVYLCKSVYKLVGAY